MPIIRNVGGSSDDNYDDSGFSLGSTDNTNQERELKESSLDVNPDRVTTLERNALQVELGEVVFNKDTGENEYWNGSVWASSEGGSSSSGATGAEDGIVTKQGSNLVASDAVKIDEETLNSLIARGVLADDGNGNGNLIYAGLYWDDDNFRVGVLTSTPTHELEVNGQVKADAYVGSAAQMIDNCASDITIEMTGSGVVRNIVEISQADYDAGSPNAETFYIINDAI